MKRSESHKSKAPEIFRHVLVPEHILLSDEEKKELIKRLGIKPIMLPWIRASDPAAMAIGARPGDIVKIIRRSDTAGKIVVYRYVVPG